MYKHIDLLVRDDGVGHDEFVEAWERDYLPRVGEIEGLVRYEQVLPTQPDHAEFDGLAERTFDSLVDLQTALDSDAGGRIESGGGRLGRATDHLPGSATAELVGEVTVQKDEVDGDTDGRYKHSAFLVRQDGMTHDEFVDYWQSNHTPLARDIEGVVKYNTVIPAADEAAFDGVAELYFDELEDLYAALGSEGSRDYDPTKEVAQQARDDVDNFLAIDERPRLIGQSTLVVDRT
jgi:uncharacterized protein (TIGR02118 family)